MKYIKNALKALGKYIKNVLKTLGKYLEDILIFSGLAFLVIATFLWGKIAGLYALGGCLLGLGVYFTKYPLKRG